MKKISLLIVAPILFVGCSARFIPGQYASKEYHHYFDFKNDSSYVYEYGTYHLYRYSFGSWKIAGGNIKLVSSLKDSVISTNVKESSMEGEKPSINLSLNIRNGLGAENYSCYLYINDTLFKKTRCDSNLRFSLNEPIGKFYFLFAREPLNPTTDLIAFPVVTKTYTPHSTKMDVSISFNDSLFYFKVFNSETLKIKKNKIKIFNPNRRRWETSYLVTDSLNAIKFKNSVERRINR